MRPTNVVLMRPVADIARELANVFASRYELKRRQEHIFDQITELGVTPVRRRLRRPGACQRRRMVAVIAQHRICNATCRTFRRFPAAIAWRSRTKLCDFLSMPAQAQNSFDHELAVRHAISSTA